MRLKHIVLAAALVSLGHGQTLVDLRTQAKSVDFTAANTTKPFKSGTLLPATCSVGEAFFKSDAVAGANLYGCTSVNSWTLETGAGLSGLSVAVNGTTQGVQPTLNFIPGTGINETCSNNTGANRIDCTNSLNTSVALTIAANQSGAPIVCNSTTGTAAYACSFASTKTLTVYTPGMFVILTADTNNTGPATLNIDSLGVKNIKQSDGLTDPAAGMITAGRPVAIYYDGSVWRLPAYSGVPTTLAAHNFANAVNAAGIMSGAQPAFTDLSGSASVAQVKGNFSGTCDSTTFLRADGTCTALTGGGDTVTSPGGSLNVGGTPSNTVLDVSTVYLNGLYPQLNPVSGVNLYPAGITNVFAPSITNPGFRLVGGVLPSGGANLLSGSFALTIDGILSQWNASAWLSYPSISGAAPTSGHCAQFLSGYQLTDSGAPCGAGSGLPGLTANGILYSTGSNTATTEPNTNGHVFSFDPTTQAARIGAYGNSTTPAVEMGYNSATGRGYITFAGTGGNNAVLTGDQNAFILNTPNAGSRNYFESGGTIAASYTNTDWTFQIPTRLTPVAFSALPACAAGTEGEYAAINNSTVNTWGTTITGGGANHVLAYCDGTSWTVAGK